MKPLALIVTSAALVLAACSSDDATTTVATDTTAPAAAPSTTAAAPATSAPPATASPTTAPPTTLAPTTLAPTASADNDPTVEIAIGVSEGQVEGDDRASVAIGLPVRIVVAADVSDEVHVHGYDLFADVSPDADAVIEFVADVPGIFEVELEDQGLELIRLEVS